MANDWTVNIVGNLTNDPELRFTPSGAAVANFTIAFTPRSFDRNSNEWKDGESIFVRCNVWREQAEQVAESLTKGMRVMATGRMKARSYETKDTQEKRTVWELEIDEIGPSLKYATAKVQRVTRRYEDGGAGAPQGQGGTGARQGGFGSSQGRTAAQDDPWATPGVSDGGGWGNGPDDEPPF